MTRRVAWLGALLVLAASAATAHAVQSAAPAARGLAAGRLYIAPAVSDTVDAATRTRIERRLRSRPEPIFIALVAFAPGDAFDGDATRFLSALAGRAQRAGVYVTYDARGILWTRGYRTAPDVDERVQSAAHVSGLETRFEGPPGERLLSFLSALDDPDLAAREVRAQAAFNRAVGRDRPPAPARVAEDDDGGSGGLLAIAGAIAVLLAGSTVLLVRRRRAHHVDDRPVLPARVFELAREASREDLAERADAMLIELSALIDAAPASPETRRALDAYEAAERALSGEPDIPDLVGALVCIDLGRRALRGDREPAAPCTYDPRHGPAHGEPVAVSGTDLWLCRACRADVRAGNPADVLRDGSGRPYFEGDGPWAASGYGTWADPIREVLDRR